MSHIFLNTLRAEQRIFFVTIRVATHLYDQLIIMFFAKNLQLSVFFELTYDLLLEFDPIVADFA